MGKFDILNEICFNEETERVTYIKNKYFAYSVEMFLEEMGFLNYSKEGEEKVKDKIFIDLKKGIYKYTNDTLSDKVNFEIPYDWNTFENDIRDYIKNNPIVRNSSDSNEDFWKTNNEEIVDESMEAASDIIEKLKDIYGYDIDQIKTIMSTKKKDILHNLNKQVYTAKGNPDIKLKSGKYNHIIDLFKKNDLEQEFKDKYGRDVNKYVREHKNYKVDIDILKEFGFEYLFENNIIGINDDKNWNNRIVEIKFDNQEEMEKEFNIDYSKYE